jgi:hypothetical protein
VQVDNKFFVIVQTRIRTVVFTTDVLWAGLIQPTFYIPFYNIRFIIGTSFHMNLDSE